MYRLLWISNHKPSIEQIEDAKRNNYEIIEAKVPSWGRIPPEWTMDDIRELLLPELPPLNNYHVIAVMGELTACMVVCDLARKQGIPVVTPTTKRVSVEETCHDGSVRKTSKFKHVRFRRIA